jgi:hypothetical protein
MKKNISLAKTASYAIYGLLVNLFVNPATAQTLQSVTDAPNGNHTTRNVWIGMAPAAGVTENALNLAGKIKLLGPVDTYTLGTDANQPTIYRSGINTGTAYPFNNYDHLVLQAGIQNRDIILLTGSTPTPRLVVTGTGNVGIGTTTPEGKLDVYGGAFINGGANLNIKASTAASTDPGDLVFLANNNTEYARAYVQVGGSALHFSVGATPSPKLTINSAGNVGIGTTAPGSNKLAVEGTIGARKVKVTQGTWADFVFHPDYQLPALQEVEKYIKTNQHLPEIPSAAEVQKEGLDLGEMNKKLLQKVEELTLYLIGMEKKMQQMQAEIKDLKDNNTNK